MKTFETRSYQLQNSKWVPSGILHEGGDDNLQIMERGFGPENRFDTKDEADEFFRKYFTEKGYKEAESK